jgi:hypothetical protein
VKRRANKDHLALTQDLDALHKWKQEHPRDSLELSNADFRGIVVWHTTSAKKGRHASEEAKL